jgi:hypothetical protein
MEDDAVRRQATLTPIMLMLGLLPILLISTAVRGVDVVWSSPGVKTVIPPVPLVPPVPPVQPVPPIPQVPLVSAIPPVPPIPPILPVPPPP